MHLEKVFHGEGVMMASDRCSRFWIVEYNFLDVCVGIYHSVVDHNPSL